MAEKTTITISAEIAESLVYYMDSLIEKGYFSSREDVIKQGLIDLFFDKFELGLIDLEPDLFEFVDEDDEFEEEVE
ncbi:MAG: hypothetical protein ACFFAJ_04810 [Candidatus Hodarchaeota archaeon]